MCAFDDSGLDLGALDAHRAVPHVQRRQRVNVRVPAPQQYRPSIKRGHTTAASAVNTARDRRDQGAQKRPPASGRARVCWPRSSPPEQRHVDPAARRRDDIHAGLGRHLRHQRDVATQVLWRDGDEGRESEGREGEGIQKMVAKQGQE